MPAQGLPLPPWRSASALLARWRWESLHKERISASPAQQQQHASRSPLGRAHSEPACTSEPPEGQCSTAARRPASTPPLYPPSICNSTPQVVVSGFQLPSSPARLGKATAALPARAPPLAPVAQDAAGAAVPASSGAPLPVATPAAPCYSPKLPPAQPKPFSLQKVFTVRRRMSASRQGGVQVALGLSTAAAAISMHTPAWWEALSSNRRQAAAREGGNRGSAGVDGSKGGECVCIECGYGGVGPLI